MRVKICGITRPEDALAAESAGADAIGLIFAPGSKRRVDLDAAAEIAAAVGPFLTTVGVFRDAPMGDVRRAVERLRLDAVQLHGREDERYAAELRREVTVVKAVAFHPGLRREDLGAVSADAVLVDAPAPGSGRAFDWEQASHLAGAPRMVLAGGLTPENVARGVALLRPYGVDVASGVEAQPGLKDAAKVAAFIARARAAAAAL